MSPCSTSCFNDWCFSQEYFLLGSSHDVKHWLKQYQSLFGLLTSLSVLHHWAPWFCSLFCEQSPQLTVSPNLIQLYALWNPGSEIFTPHRGAGVTNISHSHNLVPSSLSCICAHCLSRARAPKCAYRWESQNTLQICMEILGPVDVTPRYVQACTCQAEFWERKI